MAGFDESFCLVGKAGMFSGTVAQRVSGPPAHLPKTAKLRPKDVALPASKLRPISLMSCFWRIYIQARFSGSSEQLWLDSHLHHSQHGGRKKHDSAVAFTLIAERYAMGNYVGTLDLTRAFDRIGIDTLEWYGCPSFLTKGIAVIWQNQKRSLKWRKNVFPEGQDVRSSIPQGDGLSPRVMNLFLGATVKDIAAKEPETRVVVFMDEPYVAFISPRVGLVAQPCEPSGTS